MTMLRVASAILLWMIVSIGTGLSQSGGNMRVPMVSIVEESGQHLRSDGLGPYIDGVDHVNTFYNTSPTSARNYVLYATESDTERTYVRSLTYDYTSPSGGGAISRGVITKDPIGRVRVYPQTGVMTDIAVGTSVAAGRVEILQSWSGPDGMRYCLVFSSRNTPGGFTGVDGTGTSDAIITRVSADKWTIVAPAGSVGRLWQLQQGNQVRDQVDGKLLPPMDLGYYNFNFSITTTRK